jgi:DNA-binding NarL/FixJ family response regulator
MCAHALLEFDKDEMRTQPKTVRPTVLLADDHARMLESVSKLLSLEFHVVGMVSDGQEVLDAVGTLHPDLIVMDIAMPEMDGIRTARKLQQCKNKSKIVFLTVNQDEDYVTAALAAGASGYVLKSRLQSDLLMALKEALAGKTFVSRRINHK